MDAQCDQRQGGELLNEYERAKAVLNHAGNELKTIAQSAGDEGVADATEALINEMDQERLHLAVLGNFKRGKSTFINALLGSSILPTGVVPLTSVVTKISYGKTSDAVVHYKDGRCSAISFGELTGYITERGNPGNGKGISEVQISVDSPYLRNGVVLVDTPGIGSTYGDNTRTTIEFLTRLDAAIILIGSDPPISQEELDFIKNVSGFVQCIYIVQNKIDCLSEDEWREALAFSRSVIGDALGTSIDIYPLSSKRGLEAKRSGDTSMLIESGLLTFQSELERFITVDKGRVFLSSFITKMQREMSRFRVRLDLETKVLCDAEEQLNSKVSWLNSETDVVHRRMDEIDYLIDGGIDQIIRSMDDKLDILKKERKQSIMTDLQKYLEELDPRLSAGELTQAIETYLSESIVQTYATFLDGEEKVVSEAFISLVRRHEGEVNSIEEQLKNEVCAMFGIEIRSYPASSLDIGQSKFRFDKAELLNYRSIIPAELPFLLPKPLFRKAMRKKAIVLVETELDKHGGKVRYDINYRLSENARMVKNELRARLLYTADAMKEAVSVAMSFREKGQAERQRRTAEVLELRDSMDLIWARTAALQQDLQPAM